MYFPAANSAPFLAVKTHQTILKRPTQWQLFLTVHLKCCFATQGAMKGLATYYCNPTITRVAVSDTWWRPHHFRIWQPLKISMDTSMSYWSNWQYTWSDWKWAGALWPLKKCWIATDRRMQAGLRNQELQWPNKRVLPKVVARLGKGWAKLANAAWAAGTDWTLHSVFLCSEVVPEDLEGGGL